MLLPFLIREAERPPVWERDVHSVTAHFFRERWSSERARQCILMGI